MFVRFLRAGAAVAACLVLAAGMVSAAELKEWELSQNNWQQGEGLLPEPILNRVKSGDYHYRVKEVDPDKLKQNYSQKFWQASEANQGKYDVDEKTCGLKDLATGKMPEFYYGFPFPKIDVKNDPHAACKMAWNFEAANSTGGGGGATFTMNGVDTNGEFKRIKMWLAGQNYLGRNSGPIPNPENLRSAAILGLIEPQDVDGVAGLTKRPNDWEGQDQAWFYVPATRRVRRVNAATRSDPAAGLDVYADDVNCYAGKVEYYKWKVVGEGTILAPVVSAEPLKQKWTGPTHAEVEIPYFRAAYETPGAKGAPWLIVENLVMIPRPVWILHGESEDPFYNFGKVIMYMDKDMYRIWWKLVHNRAGEYFYNAMCAFHWSANDDGTFKTVTPNMVVGVNDKTNRSGIAGRYSSQFIETKFDEDRFSLHELTHSGD